MGRKKPDLTLSGGGSGQSASALPRGISDVNPFRYCQGVIDLDAKISDRALNLGMPKQELDSPQVACSPIDQGSLFSLAFR